MSGDHGYDPFGFGEPNPAMEAAVAEIYELQGELARLRAENERLRAALEAAKPFLYLLWPRVRLPKGVRRPEGWEWELFKRRAAAALKDEP